MPRKESNAVSGKKDSPPLDDFASGDMKIADLYRMLCEAIDSRFDRQQKIMDSRFDKQQKRMDSFFDGMDSCFDRWNRKLDEISDEARVMDQHVTSLEHGARQPRLAMEIDGPATLRLASARRAPLQQYKQCVGIAVLLHKRFKMDRRPR